MLPRRLISDVRPMADQTLMSFARMAQATAGMPRQNFDLLLGGSSIVSDRRAERREFDFESLSRFLNASPMELRAMSERTVFSADLSAPPGGMLANHAPWCCQVGYGPHCPCCLEEQGHWRRPWLSPDAFVCDHHETLLIHHCYACACRLQTTTWRTSGCHCPQCGADLSLGPRVEAPSLVQDFSASLRLRYAELTRQPPGPERDHAVAMFSGAWRATHWITMFPELLEGLQTLVDVGEVHGGCAPEEIAMRDAQSAMIGYSIARLWPRFDELLWLSRSQRRLLDVVVLEGIGELCDALGVRFDFNMSWSPQRLLSFEPNIGAAA